MLCLRLDKRGLVQRYDGSKWRGQDRYGDRVDSATTNGSGKITVTHGAGFTPQSVNVTPIAVPYQVSVESFTSTTFVVLFADAAGAAKTSTNVGFTYECIEAES